MPPNAEAFNHKYVHDTTKMRRFPYLQQIQGAKIVPPRQKRPKAGGAAGRPAPGQTAQDGGKKFGQMGKIMLDAGDKA